MPNTIHSQIKSTIDAFANDLEALVRRAAIEAVGGALGTAPKKAGRPVGSGKKPAAIKAPAARRGGRRTRRSPGAMAAAEEKILKHIKAHPNQRSEEIRSALALPKNVWQPAAKSLLDGKKIASKGVKRATTYTAK